MLNGSRIIWVDAVCINQADPEEKTLQVTMMNLIYSRAEEVMIWLGEDDTYCNLFVRYCQWDKSRPKWDRFRDMAAEQLTSARKWIKDEVTPAAISDEDLRDIVLDLFGQKYGLLADNSSFLQHFATQVKEGFIRFVSRPWFKRIWVYQEVMLAQKDLDRWVRASILFRGCLLS